MSDDHFYARAYGRVSAVADNSARLALLLLDLDEPMARSVIRKELERLLRIVSEIQAEDTARLDAIDERVKRRLDIIPLPVEVQ